MVTRIGKKISKVTSNRKKIPGSITGCLFNTPRQINVMLLQQSLCVDHKKLWKILKEMRIPDHMT